MNDIDNDIDNLIYYMETTSLFSSEDEYNLLLEGYNADGPTFDILTKAKQRYSRYIQNIDLSENNKEEIRSLIYRYMYLYDRLSNDCMEMFNIMKRIDILIYNFIHGITM